MSDASASARCGPLEFGALSAPLPAKLQSFEFRSFYRSFCSRSSFCSLFLFAPDNNTSPFSIQPLLLRGPPLHQLPA